MEYENALKSPVLEGNPRGRLDWFFKRSPYADQRLNRYPVIRLRSAVGGVRQYDVNVGATQGERLQKPLE